MIFAVTVSRFSTRIRNRDAHGVEHHARTSDAAMKSARPRCGSFNAPFIAARHRDESGESVVCISEASDPVSTIARMPLRSLFRPILAAALLLTLSCGTNAYAGRQRAVRTVPNREWARGAVFYEIFVRSFVDSDGDGIGDFNGLISKLDYVRDLGAD